MQLLECLDLYATYSGAYALRGASFSMAPGEIIGLCGPNKAGKSTLGLCLAGAKIADRGRVMWKGQDVSRLPASMRLPLGISLCPENRGIYATMTVLDNFKVGADGLPAFEIKSRMDRVLEYFPLLAERLQQIAGTLSGGEAQMLGIARKLLRRPALLIIDEPSRGLSPLFITKTLQAINRIREDFDVTVLLIEEGLNRLADWVDRAYVLNQGVIVGEGVPQELAREEIVRSVFFPS